MWQAAQFPACWEESTALFAAVETVQAGQFGGPELEWLGVVLELPVGAIHKLRTAQRIDHRESRR